MMASPTRKRHRLQGPLLVLTRIWPTRARPSVGSFVRARVSRLDGFRVVRPRWPQAPRLLVYFTLLVDGLRLRGPIRGVEAHMLIPTGFVGLIIARTAPCAPGGLLPWRRRAGLARAACTVPVPIPYRGDEGGCHRHELR